VLMNPRQGYNTLLMNLPLEGEMINIVDCVLVTQPDVTVAFGLRLKVQLMDCKRLEIWNQRAKKHTHKN
jgi:hypothetical protein